MWAARVNPRDRNENGTTFVKLSLKSSGFPSVLVGDSLTVEPRTLTPLVEVRILVPQPLNKLNTIRVLRAT